MITPGTPLLPLDEEKDLVARVKQGDVQAAAALFQRYGDTLYRTTILPRVENVELAEDALRETFKSAFEKIEVFNYDKNRSIFYWLRRIAVNQAMDVHRSYQRLRTAQARMKVEASTTREEPVIDEEFDFTRRRAKVDRAMTMLERIKPRYAEALRLRLLEDQDREDCAAKLGVSVGAFDVLLHRAAKEFRRLYRP